MSKRKKIILAVLIIPILIELSPLNFSLIRSWHNSSQHESSHSEKSEGTSIVELDLDQNPEYELRIRAFDESEVPDGRNVVEVRFRTFKEDISWLRFMPYFKYVRYSMKVNYKFETSVLKNQKIVKLEGSGEINEKGTYKVLGIWAGRLISEEIRSEFEQDVREKIYSQIQAQLEEI